MSALDNIPHLPRRMSALENIGPHLLGRRPSPPDARDYQLALWLSADPGDKLLAQLLTSHAAAATKAYAKWAHPGLAWAVAQAPVPVPPTPSPTPAGAVSWADTEPVLDQGQTPHCVGFAGAQWGNTQPVDDQFENADGNDLYYACKIVDGEPNAEDGSDSRSLAKVLQRMGRLQTYAFAASVAEVIAWLQTNGPVLVGTNWTNDMFGPDPYGVIHPTGAVAGGHEYVAVGYDPATDLIEFLNSWGSGWGKNGRFYMHANEWAQLLAEGGEALAAVELPVAA